MPYVEPAPAKLNLALHVRARRADGYHELETLFAFCTDGDIITATPASSDSFAVTGPFATALAAEGDNLVTRAAAAFRATFDGVGHAITLDKRLPVASGIGGGSADAAATLRVLARLGDVAVDHPKLVVIARALGADVPACLFGRAALGTGRGDDLTPVEGLGGAPVLLVNPLVAVPTGAVFARWDGVDRGAMPPGGALAALEHGRNDLEPPARAVAPAIGEALALLSAQPGARFARMSGSGATCFALFGDPVERDAAAGAIGAAQPGWWRLATSIA